MASSSVRIVTNTHHSHHHGHSRPQQQRRVPAGRPRNNRVVVPPSVKPVADYTHYEDHGENNLTIGHNHGHRVTTASGSVVTFGAHHQHHASFERYMPSPSPPRDGDLTAVVYDSKSPTTPRGHLVGHGSRDKRRRDDTLAYAHTTNDGDDQHNYNYDMRYKQRRSDDYDSSSSSSSSQSSSPSRSRSPEREVIYDASLPIMPIAHGGHSHEYEYQPSPTDRQYAEERARAIELEHAHHLQMERAAAAAAATAEYERRRYEEEQQRIATLAHLHHQHGYHVPAPPPPIVRRHRQAKRTPVIHPPVVPHESMSIVHLNYLNINNAAAAAAGGNGAAVTTPAVAAPVVTPPITPLPSPKAVAVVATPAAEPVAPTKDATPAPTVASDEIIAVAEDDVNEEDLMPPATPKDDTTAAATNDATPEPAAPPPVVAPESKATKPAAQLADVIAAVDALATVVSTTTTTDESSVLSCIDMDEKNDDTATRAPTYYDELPAEASLSVDTTESATPVAPSQLPLSHSSDGDTPTPRGNTGGIIRHGHNKRSRSPPTPLARTSVDIAATNRSSPLLPPNRTTVGGTPLVPSMVLNTARGFDGFIFECNTSTFEEHMRLELFAAPKNMSVFVCSITAHDTPMFLFHHNTRCLYGVFEATRPGAENINPWAFTDGTQSTPFPAQVPVRYKYKFLPLPEAKFHHLINWLPGGTRPVPQVSRAQIKSLIAAFAAHDADTALRASTQLSQCFRL